MDKLLKRDEIYNIVTINGSQFKAKIISKYCKDEITYGIKVGEAYGEIKKSEINFDKTVINKEGE